MATVRNVLFVMADQLRWDYLSCYGHPRLATPHIDRIAAEGVRYTRAYCSSPVCGPSRMSFYTGRTASSHGASWNFVPLAAGERTLGEHLRPHGVRTAVVGKTHMFPDLEGLQRLGIAPGSDLGLRLSECGFEPYARDDGVHPAGKADPDLAYNRWLRAHGYDGENPWHDHANAALGPDGTLLSGWHLRHARLPARVQEAHSETAYTTDRALDFMREAGEQPWVLHLSYIKPHWPLIAPAPYHQLFGDDDVPPAVRHAREREHAHPVQRAFMDMECSRTYADDAMRRTAVPTYMGLVKQLDDHLGRVLAYLDASGRIHDTAIVFTSDHGDYLGDHWLGEKELFHEPSVRIPLIVRDPDPRADATRGSTDARMVEAIDVVPSILDLLGVPVPGQHIEGRSLLPAIRSAQGAAPWRDCAFSEIDYAFYSARTALGLGPNDAHAFMLRSERWKFVHYQGFAPQLFDLAQDPGELEDLGASAAHAGIRSALQAALLDRLAGRRHRSTLSDAAVEARTDVSARMGVLIGRW